LESWFCWFWASWFINRLNRQTCSKIDFDSAWERLSVKLVYDSPWHWSWTIPCTSCLITKFCLSNISRALAKTSTTSCGGGRDGGISFGRGLTRPPLVDFIALKFHEDPISFPKRTKSKYRNN
jgi:hypothetical protein